MMRGSLSDQLKGLLMPSHAKRHASALRIAAALHRAERTCKDPHSKAALKELHDALADAVTAHGAEIGIGGDVTPFSGGIPKDA